MTPSQVALFDRLTTTMRAGLLRAAKKVRDGYEGDILIRVRKGGVSYIQWIQVENGEAFRNELDEG